MTDNKPNPTPPNERCYIVNLRVIENHVLAYVRRRWVKTNTEHSNFLHSVTYHVDKFVFGIAQGIGKYYSPNTSRQQVFDINGAMDLFAVQYSITHGATQETGRIEAQHLKKIVEDFIIEQLSAAMSNHGVFNPTITRYSACQQDNKEFLFCC